MAAWIADCIISGIDAFGQPLTYQRAMENLKNMNAKLFKNVKKQVDNILINKGRADLIQKI